MGRRDEQRRQTRQAILEAAYRLFAEHGYDDTTVEMIATEASVAPRTFFRYFETKDGVVTHIGFDIIERLLARVRRDPSVAGLIRELASVFEASLPEPQVQQAMVMFREHPHLLEQAAMWRGRWAGQLADGLAEAAGRPTALPHRVKASVAVHTVTLCVDEWLQDGGTVREFAEVAVETLQESSPTR